MAIDGTTRAVGDGNAEEYAAIDTQTAVLDGIFQILPNSAYVGPATRGTSDQFMLIASQLGITGAFDTVSYDGTPIGATATYVGQTNGGGDGLFASYLQSVTQVVLTNYLALPGDANGDGFVNNLDLNVRNANKFTTGGN
jgi:hypothetical protein